MSRNLAILFALLFAGATAFGLFQYWDVQTRDLEIARLNHLLGEANAARDLAEKSASTAREDLAKAPTATEEPKPAKPTLAGDGAAAPASTPAAPKPANPMAAYAEMFKTPEGKKMLKSQMGFQMRMLFGNLPKTLNLSAADSELVMGILGDRQMTITEQTFAFMDGPVTDQKLADFTASSEQAQNEYDTKLKAVLGDAKFQQMKDYERTIGDRMMLSQADFSSAGAPLADGQRDALLKLMTDTRKNSPAPVFDPGGQNMAKGIRALQEDTSTERHLKQESEYQNKVLQAATGILNPDQISALQKGFEGSLQMQKSAIEMSKLMFPKPATPAK